MYDLLFRHVLSKMDPERAHHLAFRVIQAIPQLKLDGLAARFTAAPRDTDLSVHALGRRFPTPFGLAAGFDKDGKAIRGFGALGFGHVEVGTITARPQPGNPTPRLFRLIPDRAVVNRMGFNNGGAAAASLRLARVRSLKHSRPVIGVNIGKSRAVEVDDAVEDYLQSARALAPMADYLVVNVSSPNTPGLRGLQELDKLAPLLSAVKAEAGATPLLVKIAPDLTDDEVRKISELAVSLGLDGIIATNTTISREGLKTDATVVEAAGAGGLSGAPLAERSLAVLKLIRAVVPAELCVISVGGIDTAADVQQRLDAGATLVQGYTAFLYRGPLWARQINRGLARLRA
ncbi:quinone-dependent dihydroorotate dehydrogenase [Herbiconiux sp. YIM B11900]|uniref:quinone-dependent dihydroorotate dehydrogenase n=1 Tax=Herbiconiux sp. YIM B11900 TaxID=3404131 RepID=UPI003F82682A